MGIIILVSVCIALAILGVVLYNIYDIDNWLGVSIICSLLSAIAVPLLFLTLINIDREFEVKIANYNSLKQTIECSRESNSEFERVELIKQIHETNKVINEHRIMHSNFWTGIWYSEEIGKLELLK